MQRTYFNTTEIIWATSWKEKPEKLKNTYMTEAGTEIDQIVRPNKLFISASYKCTDKWLKTFMEFRDLNSFTLKTYNALTKTYKTNTVRMTNFTHDLVHKSEDLGATNGVWKVSFYLEEF
jgi:hypothetical protein